MISRARSKRFIHGTGRVARANPQTIQAGIFRSRVPHVRGMTARGGRNAWVLRRECCAGSHRTPLPPDDSVQRGPALGLLRPLGARSGFYAAPDLRPGLSYFAPSELVLGKEDGPWGTGEGTVRTPLQA